MSIYRKYNIKKIAFIMIVSIICNCNGSIFASNIDIEDSIKTNSAYEIFEDNILNESDDLDFVSDTICIEEDGDMTKLDINVSEDCILQQNDENNDKLSMTLEIENDKDIDIENIDTSDDAEFVEEITKNDLENDVVSTESNIEEDVELDNDEIVKVDAAIFETRQQGAIAAYLKFTNNDKTVHYYSSAAKAGQGGSGYVSCRSYCDTDNDADNKGIVYESYPIADHLENKLYNVTKVIIEDKLNSIYTEGVGSSLGSYTFKNMFKNFYNLESIENIDNLSASLNRRDFFDLSGIFQNCRSLEEIDLSSFDTKNIKDMSNMFNGCSSLKTIIASSSFVTTQVTKSTDMFKNCSVLVGGNNTSYDSNYIDKEYARIDTTSSPGYFTSVLGNTGSSTEVKSISISSQPNKVQYEEGECFDPTGLIIDVEDDDGTDTIEYNEDTKDDFIFNPTINTPLDINISSISVTYREKTIFIPLTITGIKNIQIIASPSQLRYLKGSIFNPIGLKIKVEFSNNTTDVIEYNETNKSLFKFNNTQDLALNVVGNPYNIIVNYKNKTCNVDVVVAEIKNISIFASPSKTTYYKNDTFDPTGLVLSIEYTDSHIETIEYNQTTMSDFTFATPSTGLTRVNNNVTIKYKNYDTLATDLKLNIKEIRNISTKSNPNKLNFNVGDNFDPTGLAITVTYIDSYNNISTEDIAYNEDTKAKFTFFPNGALNSGDQIFISYDGFALSDSLSNITIENAVAPSVPAHIDTSSSGTGYNGGGSGGGGGCGGGDAPKLENTNNTASISYILINNKIITAQNILNKNTLIWNYDALVGKYSLIAQNALGGLVIAVNGFYEIDNGSAVQGNLNDYYYFDDLGKMLTGFAKSFDNKIYYFEENPNINIGKMAVGWKLISNSWYYFDIDGHMLFDCVTPDGFKLDKNGKWIKY